MKKIIGCVLIVLLFVAGGFLYNFITPKMEQKDRLASSDAGKMQGELTIALDDWVGYFPFRSVYFKGLLLKAGWHVKIDENPDIARRMELIAGQGKGPRIDFAVFDISSNILKGAAYGFPTRILLVNDLSQGGDSIWANAEKVPNLDALKGNTKLKIAFTPDSPSHHLLKAASFHFAVPEIVPPKGDPRRVEVNGSSEALKKLVSGEVDVAVVWEPDGSRLRAMKNKKFVRLLGTEDTDKVIIDLFLARKEFAERNPEVTNLVVSAYFQTLKYYRDNPDILIKQIKEESNLSETDVKEMLKGIYWPTLQENCEKWFGIGTKGVATEAGIVDAIESTVRILVNSKDFPDNPIPNGNPFYLTLTKALKTLYDESFGASTVNTTGKSTNTLETKFAALDPSIWNKLTQIGTMKVDPIMFLPGSSDLTLTSREVVDDAAENLKRYPKFRLIIKGHTARSGDKEENRILSQERADSVAQYFEVVYNVDPNRLLAIGRGGEEPLPQKSGETKQAWERRLPRVELVLVRDEL